MRFVNSCYIDRGKIAVAERSLDGDGKPSWRISKASPDDLSGGIANNRKDVERPSLRDAMRLVYNVSLGQRSTTPEYLNQFVDRYDKTFFRPNMRLSMALTQDAVTTTSAMANYLHMGQWNPSVGVVERIYRDVRSLQATLALLLLDGLDDKRGAGSDSEIVNSKKKNNLKDQEIGQPEIDALRAAVGDDRQAALRLVEGAMATCCWRDHSRTEKDLHNSKIKAALTPYLGLIDEVSFDPGEFWRASNISALSALADVTGPGLWVVRTGADAAEDVSENGRGGRR